MPVPIKVLKDFKKISNTKLESFANYVLAKMSNNPKFTSLADEIAELEVLLKTYVAAYVAAHERGTKEIIIRNAAKTKLIDLLSALVDAVNFLAKGDVTTLIESGFNHTILGKDAATALTPIERASFSYTPTKGIVIIRYKKQLSAYSAAFVYSDKLPAMNPAAEWNTITFNKASHEVDLRAYSGYIYGKIVLYGKLGDQVESPIFEIAITKTTR